MKIQFHSHGGLNESPHFMYSMKFPPKGVTYYFPANMGDVILNMKNIKFIKTFFGLAKTFLSISGKSAANISTPEKVPGYVKLIHSFNTIPDTDKPFIIELEVFHSVFIGNPGDENTINLIKKLLSRPNCKKILFWTQNAYDNFNKLMDDKKILAKSMVLYPGVPLYTKNKTHRIPTIGFIARDFINKGGEFILPIMEQFVSAGKAKAIVVTNTELVGEELLNKYKNTITFLPLMERNKLHKDIFPKIDILFYPGFSDSFGYAMPEAMSHGIPIVTFDGCARREIVHHCKGGYVAWGKLSKWGFLETKPVTDSEKEHASFATMIALTNLTSNKKLWAEMSEYNYNLVKSGQFSLAERNKKLKKVYKEALK